MRTFLLVSVSLMTFISGTHQVVENLSAVSYFQRSLPLYLHMKDIGSTSRETNIDRETKDRICVSILNSSVYNISKFQVSPIVVKVEDISNPNFENPISPIEVYIRTRNQKWPENVFKCQDKFISEEYNMNDKSDSSTNYIVGRFLFVRGTPFIGNEITLATLAEEPAKALFHPQLNSLTESSRILNEFYYQDLEKLYLERKGKHGSTGSTDEKRSENDPLCKQDLYHRYRLCGLVYNSEYFKALFSEHPRDKENWPNEELDCHYHKVSLRNTGAIDESTMNQLQEFMIECSMFIDYPKGEYFLSWGYNDLDNDTLSSNDVFLYQRKDDGIFLENMFTNIRI